MAKPKITYRIHDPEVGSSHDTDDPKYVSDYIRDDFMASSPVHVETFHDGVSQGIKTHDPKDWGDLATGRLKPKRKSDGSLGWAFNPRRNH